MSDSLSTAYTAWLALISANETTFQGYVTSIEVLNTSLGTANAELVALKGQLTVIADNMDAEKNDNAATTLTYSTLLAQYNAKNAEITTKQNTINGYNAQITAININITALNNLLSISTNFTLVQRQELSKMTIEAKLNMESVSDEAKLYEYAVEYLTIKNKPSIDIEIDLIDLFSINSDFISSKYDKIKVGNYIYLDCSSLNFNYDRYRITRINHSKLDNKLSITISNKDRLNSEINYLNRIFKASAESAAVVETNKDDYGQYVKDSDTILYNDDTITNDIENGNITITKRGFMGSDIGSNGAIQLKNDKLIISTDNWTTFHTLLSGNGLYLEKNDKMARIVINPQFGFQIDKNEGTISSPIWSNQFYIDNDGNVIMDGRLKITSNGNILLDAYQDTYGGILNIYDASGNLDCKIGVESGTGSNTGGTLVLYNDSISKPRVEMGIRTDLDAGGINLKDTNGNNLVTITADSPYGQYIAVKDSSGNLISYLTLTEGYINSEKIATEDWVTANFAPL